MCVLISDYLLVLLTVLSSFLSTASDSPFSLTSSAANAGVVGAL